MFRPYLGIGHPQTKIIIIEIWKFLDCEKAKQSLTDMKKTKQIMKERPEQRAAGWIYYDRRIQDYQN